MLVAYIDESFDQRSNFYVMAGYVASEEQWTRFEPEWLSIKGETGYTKMKKAGRWSADKKEADLARVHNTICEHVRFGFQVAVDGQASREVLRDVAEYKNGNPYQFCFFMTMMMVLTEMHRLGEEGPIRFVYDHQMREERHCLDFWSEFIGSAPPHIRAKVSADPTFADDENCLPLQTADFRAWWARNQINLNAGLEADQFELRPPNGKPVIRQLWHRETLLRLKADVDRITQGVLAPNELIRVLPDGSIAFGPILLRPAV